MRPPMNRRPAAARRAPKAPAGPASPLNQQVAGAVRERILAGVFAPGERLAEEKLSLELGVSRVPVREALRHLAAEGLVVLRPRRGAVVFSHTEEEMRDLVEVRATLEGLNARLAARRHDPKQMAELERILRDGARVTERSDLALIQRSNARFHEAIEAIAANSVLMGIVRTLRDRTALIFARRSRVRVRRNWEEHAGIVRAILAGDEDKAARLAYDHVYSAAREDVDEAPAAPKRALRRRTGS